jgi:hypothetical protein
VNVFGQFKTPGFDADGAWSGDEVKRGHGNLRVGQRGGIVAIGGCG